MLALHSHFLEFPSHFIEPFSACIHHFCWCVCVCVCMTSRQYENDGPVTDCLLGDE